MHKYYPPDLFIELFPVILPHEESQATVNNRATQGERTMHKIETNQTKKQL